MFILFLQSFHECKYRVLKTCWTFIKVACWAFNLNTKLWLNIFFSLFFAEAMFEMGWTLYVQAALPKSSSHRNSMPKINHKKMTEKLLCSSAMRNALVFILISCQVQLLLTASTAAAASTGSDMSECPRPDEIAPCQCRMRGPSVQVR